LLNWWIVGVPLWFFLLPILPTLPPLQSTLAQDSGSGPQQFTSFSPFLFPFRQLFPYLLQLLPPNYLPKFAYVLSHMRLIIQKVRHVLSHIAAFF
jgi:hypothetical protein